MGGIKLNQPVAGMAAPAAPAAPAATTSSRPSLCLKAVLGQTGAHRPKVDQGSAEGSPGRFVGPESDAPLFTGATGERLRPSNLWVI